MERIPLAGQQVKYVDEHKVEHDALVTAPWSASCANICYVSKDPAKTDPYGSQIERKTSVPHGKTFEFKFGNYWKFADE